MLLFEINAKIKFWLNVKHEFLIKLFFVFHINIYVFICFLFALFIFFIKFDFEINRFKFKTSKHEILIENFFDDDETFDWNEMFVDDDVNHY